ncbi:hypothetical protein MHBO_004949 [Bonamia ostreae]|uniref:Uncharacterized protein n=1 Tax=Bonamia ostreae TaxID=126728 RepID=A0ABV2AUP7_9EUKA
MGPFVPSGSLPANLNLISEHSNVPSESFVAPAIPTEADKGTDNDKGTVADTDVKDVASLNVNGDKTNDDSSSKRTSKA